jgi:4-hydroxybenzoate polyprenyltransferase
VVDKKSASDFYKNQIVKWGSLVKFSHTVFAMPFALAMMVYVFGRVGVSVSQVFWILLCLVSARTGAMALNRLLDRKIDSLNPRTKERELPAGRVTENSVKLLLAVSYGIFILGAGMLGQHTLILALPVLAILSFYSWTKRFTQYSHFVLGLALSLAPGGVWYALVATVELLPILLMVAVLLWVTGFDIIYSCQDEQFDRSQGLFSIPAKIGVARALQLARLVHLVAIMFLLLFGYCADAGLVFYVGWILFSLLILSQHSLISPSDLSRVNEAFFVRNGLGSFLFFLGSLFDLLVRI